jgi:hypothetical protein
LVYWIISPPLTVAVPNFSPGCYILSDEQPITGDNVYSSPEVADWNADGLKDLMVGVFFEGNIWLYLNEGTDSEPLFGEGTLLEADGTPISVGYG